MENFQKWLYSQFNWDSTKQNATRQFGLKFMRLNRILIKIYFTSCILFLLLVALFFFWQHLTAVAVMSLANAIWLALTGAFLNWYCLKISNLLWLTEIEATTGEILTAAKLQANE